MYRGRSQEDLKFQNGDSRLEIEPKVFAPPGVLCDHILYDIIKK